MTVTSTLSSDPSTTLMLIGGNWQYPATEDPYGVSIYLDFLERAGGVENAKIGILTTASSSAQSARRNGKLYVQDFQDLYDLYLKDEYPNSTIEVEWIPFHVGNAEKKEDNKKLIKQLKEYTGIIFGGGDQSLITDAFFDDNPQTGKRIETPIYKALKEQFEKGVVIAGTSAGATVQTSFPMITEGESYEGLLNGSTPLIGSPPFVRDLYFNPLGGLGFFNYGLVDTHFSERGRQGRIIRLASEVDGAPLAFGVDENTALIVTDADTPDVNMTVLGEGGVFIADLSSATVDSDPYWSIEGVNATYLTEGDEFDPLSKTVSWDGKRTLVGKQPTNPTTDNVFSWKDPETGDWTDPRSLTETAIALFRSKATMAKGFSYEVDPVQYLVTLTKTDDSQGAIGKDSIGVKTISFVNLALSITPISL